MGTEDPSAALDEAVAAERWAEVDLLAAELAASIGAPEIENYGEAARELARTIRSADLRAMALAYVRLARLRERIRAGKLDPPERRATLGWWKR